MTNYEPSNTAYEPSNTAMTAAAARAAHLVVDSDPFIFADTRAADLLGKRSEELLGYHRQHGTHPILTAARAQVVCRSRYTEDRLAIAAANGVRQYVVLGAGLDTFAYRSPLAAAVQVFEVDHPAMQAWKRSALASAGFAIPPGVAFVPADLTVAADGGSVLAAALQAAGFNFSRPAVVSWLGVLMYLDRPAIGQTLAGLSDCAPGTELIGDYMLPRELRDQVGDLYVDLVGQAAAERGEPWLSFFTPAEMSELLSKHGFVATVHVRQRDAVPAELWQRTDALRPIDLSMIAWSRLGGG